MAKDFPAMPGSRKPLSPPRTLESRQNKLRHRQATDVGSRGQGDLKTAQCHPSPSTLVSNSPAGDRNKKSNPRICYSTSQCETTAHRHFERDTCPPSRLGVPPLPPLPPLPSPRVPVPTVGI